MKGYWSRRRGDDDMLLRKENNVGSVNSCQVDIIVIECQEVLNQGCDVIP